MKISVDCSIRRNLLCESLIIFDPPIKKYDEEHYRIHEFLNVSLFSNFRKSFLNRDF